jgi:hypothetical protein
MEFKSQTKKIVIFLILFIAAFSALSWVTGYALVIPISSYKNTFHTNIKQSDKVNPFSKFDFTKDRWTAYLIIDGDDFTDLDPAIPKVSCLKTNDRKVLQQMKKTWIFNVNNGDAGTVTSDLYLFQNGKLVYKSGIILLKTNQRLQNEEYGEMTPIDSSAMVNSCKQFHKLYLPVVIL